MLFLQIIPPLRAVRRIASGDMGGKPEDAGKLAARKDEIGDVARALGGSGCFLCMLIKLVCMVAILQRGMTIETDQTR